MPNVINANGLETSSQQELQDEFTSSMETIYGPDVNLEPSTPDAQMMMIFIQSVIDAQDLIANVNNQFDPDNATGVILDQRVAINGIQRKGATYTVTPIEITTDRALTLYGLDQDVEEPYTVKDNAGTEFTLLETFVFSVADTDSLLFRAAEPGEVLTVPNTITLPVTIVLGVTDINNPTSYTILGQNEESDQALKLRRQQSISANSQGYYASLYAALLNLDGMESVYIYENVTGSTDGDGIPGHGIWVIVNGTADDADIAQAIYNKRNAGCNMKGSETYDVEQVDGTFFEIRWDDVSPVDLWIEFDASSLNGIDPPLESVIKDYLVANFRPGVNGQVNINDLATLVQQADPNTLVTNAGFSLTEMGSYTSTLSPSAKNEEFVISADKINITVV